MALQGSIPAGAERMRSLDSKLHFQTLPFRAGSFLIPSPLPSVWNSSAPQPVDQPGTSIFWAQRIPSGAKHPLHPKAPNPKNRSRAGFNPSLNDPYGIFPSAPLRLFSLKSISLLEPHRPLGVMPEGLNPGILSQRAGPVFPLPSPRFSIPLRTEERLEVGSGPEVVFPAVIPASGRGVR